MRQRCLLKTYHRYPTYGGSGITICDRWKDSFENFLADMGERPEATTLDRIDNSKGYTPENCRWSSITEQNRNKRTNVNLTFNGRTQCLAAWAKEFHLNKYTLRGRLKSGWPLELALTKPPSRKTIDVHL